MNPRPPASVPDTRQLRQWDATALWHAFTQMAEYEPLIFTSGRGATLVDDEGVELIDAVSSMWCNVHGHAHPRLNEAIRRQLDQVAHVTLLGASNPTTIRLAHELTERSPDGLTRVFFSSDGAAAVEIALKLAFQYWQQRPDPRPGKTTYVALGNAYHGDTLGSVSVGGVERFHEMYRPLLFPVHRAPCPDNFRLPADVPPEQAASHYLDGMEQILAEHHEEIAAVVLEPLIQCAAGMVMHPAGYLRGVSELARKYDVLLIVDEVATGFGRTGRMFACEHEQVTPDLMCLGKGLTGGYLPMSATLATDEIWNAFLGDYSESRHFFHGHTFSGNPLAAAAALASLELFDEEDVLTRVAERSAQLGRHLERIRSLPDVGDARQIGLIGAIDLCLSPELKIPFPWSERRGQRVCDYARRHGVFMRPLGSILVIMPPLCVTGDELDMIMEVVADGIVATCQ